MKEFHTYLTFDGNAKEAMSFYANCLGADLNIVTFGDAQVPCPENEKDKLMHANIMKNGATLLMASDTISTYPVAFVRGNNFSISIQTESKEETEKLFSSLIKGGSIVMPVQETPWAHAFGMLDDQFGVKWMLNFPKPMHK